MIGIARDAGKQHNIVRTMATHTHQRKVIEFKIKIKKKKKNENKQ